MRSQLVLLSIYYVCYACTPTSSNKEAAVDSISVVVDSVNLSEPETIQPAIPDPFDDLLQATTPLLLNWGFEIGDTLTFNDSVDFKKHWWLKNLTGPMHRLATPVYWPEHEDWEMIDFIRQHQFVRSWKYSLEVWEFKDRNGASRWYEIAKNTTRVDDAKPPRYFWVEGGKLMFLMATAAKDWFEHSEDLIVTLRGNTSALINLFEDPIDLHAFKIKKRGANSSSVRKRPYFHRPDTIGTYFKYFWFHAYRRIAAIDNPQDAVIVNTYIYGDTITTYEEVKEALISIKGMVEDPDLDRLNVVGLTRQDVLDKFGLAEIREQNLYVYEHKKDILILSFKDDQVEWFNFLRTNLDINNFRDLPPELHYYNERLPVTNTNRKQ